MYLLMIFEAKYLGSNGWLIKFDKTNLIIDPWLTGDLVFPPGEWFFKGTLDTEILIEDEIDIILLTQGLPDHCHIPSLKKFKKNTYIICPNSAKGILEKSGFTSIKVLKPSERVFQATCNFKSLSTVGTRMQDSLSCIFSAI